MFFFYIKSIQPVVIFVQRVKTTTKTVLHVACDTKQNKYGNTKKCVNVNDSNNYTDIDRHVLFAKTREGKRNQLYNRSNKNLSGLYAKHFSQ